MVIKYRGGETGKHIGLLFYSIILWFIWVDARVVYGPGLQNHGFVGSNPTLPSIKLYMVYIRVTSESARKLDF